MTSLTLFYRRGAPAALLLGLIVGAPDITQAVQLRGVLPRHPAQRPLHPAERPLHPAP